jgi:hypothetical protein
MFRDHGDVWIVGPNDHRYTIPGSSLYVPNLTADYRDADKFLSSRTLWNQDGRTVVLYGDVYFTENARNQIVTWGRREWNLFCRFGPSQITGTPWGECFAQSFYPEHLSRHEQALHQLAASDLKRIGGWEHARLMHKADPGAEIRHSGYVEIDDLTDDLDFPEDYDRMVEAIRRNNYTPIDPFDEPA